MAAKTYDLIIIGAGSIGAPAALAAARKKLRVLVLDPGASPGQGQNKAAIGGIRATHSDAAKIKVSLDSLRIFSRWKDENGDDIGWRKGGYTFPAYTESHEKMMKELLKVQQSHGLNINWLDKAQMLKLVPGLNPENLRGGTFSPDDGSASPLASINAFYRKAAELGAEFHFGESVSRLIIEKGEITGAASSKGTYHAQHVLNAAGANAKEICAMAKIDVPISPDCHEAGITEPVRRMFEPMVVDIRSESNSANYYFYQNNEGQVVFCITPNPQIWGMDKQSTSAFLPLASRRMTNLLPRLAALKVRRTWRGLYPMTPDGFPIVDSFDLPKGFLIAGGMCGQGFMLGPGIGELLARMITGELTETDRTTLKGFSSRRAFSGMESFK
ncbi:MAG TPA: FAD-binding oxidoreductase [Elusimicrobiales bacterium]|nr:FAD-binding oxidoreductase [Elusimicrobiales bacterium]